MLRRAPTLESFSEDPIGAYFAGATWVHAAPRADLFAVILFGRPNEEEIRQLVASLRIELGSSIVPHRSTVDASRLGGVDLGAFEALTRYVGENHARLGEQVTALSLVRPSGLEGAVVAGFFEVQKPPYPVEVFDNGLEALKWHGESEAEPLLAELEAAVASEQEAPPLLAGLRAYLAAHLADALVEEASKSLRVSPRTLQRKLELAGTTFQQEVLRARLNEAERRMLASNASLTAIAVDSGFASLQHFSAAFRKRHGQSPSAWRNDQRSS